jgi:hypothetical protein
VCTRKLSVSVSQFIVPDGATDKVKTHIRTRHGRDDKRRKVFLSEEIKQIEHLKYIIPDWIFNKVCNGFVCPIIVTSDGILWTLQWTNGFHKNVGGFIDSLSTCKLVNKDSAEVIN